MGSFCIVFIGRFRNLLAQTMVAGPMIEVAVTKTEVPETMSGTAETKTTVAVTKTEVAET